MKMRNVSCVFAYIAFGPRNPIVVVVASERVTVTRAAVIPAHKPRIPSVPKVKTGKRVGCALIGWPAYPRPLCNRIKRRCQFFRTSVFGNGKMLAARLPLAQ